MLNTLDSWSYLIGAIASVGTLLMSIISFWILRVKVDIIKHEVNGARAYAIKQAKKEARLIAEHKLIKRKHNERR